LAISDGILTPNQTAAGMAEATTACGVAKLELSLAIAAVPTAPAEFFRGTIGVSPTSCQLIGSTLTITVNNNSRLFTALAAPSFAGSATIRLLDSNNEEISEPYTLTFEGMQLRIGL